MEVPNKGQPIKIKETAKWIKTMTSKWLAARPFTAKLPNNREASEDKTADLW